MGFFRLVAWVMVALGLALVGADGISTIEEGVPVVRTTAEILGLIGLNVAPDTAAEGVAARTAGFFFNTPLWALIGITGMILALIFRPIE